MLRLGYTMPEFVFAVRVKLCYVSEFYFVEVKLCFLELCNILSYDML